MAYLKYNEKNLESSKWFINEVVKKAKKFLENDEIDKELVDKIIELQKQIEDGKDLEEYFP